MDINKIKGRIQKLLAMANDSSSPEEAAIAARRVQKLMAEYNLEMVDVIAEDILHEENIVKSELNIKYKRIPGYIDWIEVAVAKAFNCEASSQWVLKNSAYYEVTTFYGYKCDVDIATTLCTYICNQLERLAKIVKIPEIYSANRLGRRYMADWRKGAANEICNRIRTFYNECDSNQHEPVTSSGQSLASMKTAQVAKKFGQFSYGTTQSYRYTPDGMAAGRAAAEAISVSQNINNNAVVLPDLT